MELERQLIFFFSALGAFNGFVLTIYIAYKSRNKKYSNLFLTLLLLVLSIRITKSVFFYFSPHLSGVFMQIGLTACSLIGPFLYLYVRSQLHKPTKYWYVHIFPFIIIMFFLSLSYPYWEFREIWGWRLVCTIYALWFIYLFASFIIIKPLIYSVFFKKVKPENQDVLMLSIFIGVSVILLAYVSSSYTSYIAGALSFSFILYLVVLLFVFRNSSTVFNPVNKGRYFNKLIDSETLTYLSERISDIEKNELFKNPDLKLSDVSKEIGISAHTISQYLNDNLGKSFSFFINEYRIEHAKKLLKSNTNYTIEAIGYESGFNSKSTFFTTFKKLTDTTPANYIKSSN